MADASIRSFAYRHPRYTTKLAMDFVAGETVILGACESISENGVYVNLSEKMQPGTAGVLNLYLGAESFSVHAMVAPATSCAGEPHGAVLNFVFRDEEERHSVRSLIAMLRPRQVG